MNNWMKIFIALGLGLKRNGHIFIGLIAGIFMGMFLHTHENPVIMKILVVMGQLFIRLIQMVVIPLVISAIIIGITSIGDNKQLGKYGTKMIFYYAIITTFAVGIGAFLSLVFKPGLGAIQYVNIASAVEVQHQVASAIEAQQGHLTGYF